MTISVSALCSCRSEAEQQQATPSEKPWVVDRFDDIKVIGHPSKKGYYGVTLKQGYTSDTYSDTGYLFLLWDFNNPEAPQIHVRTWQPEMLNETTKLPEEEIFTCEDFDIM